MPNPSEFALKFISLLNAKFTAEDEQKAKTSPHKWVSEVTVQPGKRFDKIVLHTGIGVAHSGSVHAFVEKATGHVYKAAGFNAPAKGVRFTDVETAAANADRYGSYLYAFAQKAA